MKIPASLLKPNKDSTQFIVAIEGPDGVGKTSMCNLMAEKIEFSHQTLPAQFNQYELKQRMIFEASWMASAFFFLSGVMETKREIDLNPAETHLMDRSFWSTLAVNWVKDPLRMPALLNLLDIAHAFIPIPNLIIILYASYEECKARSNSKMDHGKDLDRVSFEQYEKEIAYYHLLETSLPNVIRVDTNGLNQQQVVEVVEEKIKGFKRRLEF